MRRVVAALALCGLTALIQTNVLSAEPLDLSTIVEGETQEQLCDRLAVDPFSGFGPEQWAKPFASIDAYRAVPACVKSMKAHPGVERYVLGAALAFIAGEKNEAAKILLERLIAKGNVSAMLALAYISPDNKAADLMRRAAEAGSPQGMILFGMTQLTGKGIEKDPIDGVRLIRRAADTGSTRAMLILANFYNSGTYGVGFNPDEARSLVAKAASLGDPSAKEMLASLAEAGEEKTEQ
jgi:TPR repeat protein